MHPKATPPKAKKQKKNSSNNSSGTVTYDDMPIYLLLDECKEYRTASSGNKFIIRMIETEHDGLLPVPVWEKDNRSDEKLKNQAKRNKRSRETVYRLAATHRERGSTPSTSNSTVQSNNVQPNESNSGDTVVTGNVGSVEQEANGNTNGTREMDNNSDSNMANENQTEDNNNIVTKYTSDLSCRLSNILLIGLSYNSYVLNQLMTDHTITNISECKDENGRTIDQCVARDTYRSYILEKTYPHVKVFTVNKCTDAVRSCDNDNDPYNINCDVGTNQFVKLLSKKGWKFNEIYVDTIRMQKIYVEHNFSKNFFNNLVRLKKLNIIGVEDEIKGVVYLPFNPHFFHMVNSNDDIQAHYAISYLKQSEIGHDNHRLSHSISKK